MLFMTLKEKYEGMIPYLIFCGRANAVLLLFLFKDLIEFTIEVR